MTPHAGGALAVATCLALLPQPAVAARHGAAATHRPANAITLLPWSQAKARPVLRVGSTSVWVHRLKVTFALDE